MIYSIDETYLAQHLPRGWALKNRGKMQKSRHTKVVSTFGSKNNERSAFASGE
jgi:hypothetical protein